MNLPELLEDFFKRRRASGIILILVTVISLLLANSPWQNEYINFWHLDLGGHSIVHWINEALMTVFFLLIGLQVERQLYQGELSNIKSALLPIFAAVGGLLLPATIYLFFNFGTDTQAGAGIPMATDIAFAIGVLSLLGRRVPASLKIFLTTLAVMDDLGAIIIIAVFYTKSIALVNLFVSLGIFGILLALNLLKVRNLIPYLIGGVVMWYFMMHSGVHATITGVLLAFAIPFGNGSEKTTSFILQRFLRKPVMFFILPLFAIANTCIPLGDSWQSGLGQTVSLGIIAGLVIGKPLGIFLFSFIGVRLGFCSLPEDLKWKNILGAGFLGGIGFTMSIFITLLAFDNEVLVNNSKVAIILASVIAGTIGLIFLKLTLKPRTENNGAVPKTGAE